jgi:hypothetical protein
MSDIPNELLNIGSSPTTQWVNCRQRINIFSSDASSDGDRYHPAGHIDPPVAEAGHASSDVDVETLAAAWKTDDNQPVLPIDVKALATAYVSSSRDSAVSESDGGQPVPQIDVEALAEAYKSSPECSESDDDQLLL